MKIAKLNDAIVLFELLPKYSVLGHTIRLVTAYENDQNYVYGGK